MCSLTTGTNLIPPNSSKFVKCLAGQPISALPPTALNSQAGCNVGLPLLLVMEIAVVDSVPCEGIFHVLGSAALEAQ